MKFLKQFLSELTQTGGRFGARDFDLNQTRGKHSSFLNFPFAKVCPPFVLLAAEVAARDETRRDGKRSRFHHSHSLSFSLSTFFPLSFYLLFPPTFFPPAAISSLSFPRLRRSSEVSQVRAFDLVGGRGESASNEPIAENLSSRARRDPTSHPPQSSSPAYVFSFYPLLSRLSWFYSRPLPPSFLARRHEGEGGRRWKASMRQESKDPRRIEERKKERAALRSPVCGREIAVFFAPDGKWPRFCPSVFFFDASSSHRLSIVASVASRSANNISNQLSEESTSVRKLNRLIY